MKLLLAIIMSAFIGACAAVGQQAPTQEELQYMARYEEEMPVFVRQLDMLLAMLAERVSSKAGTEITLEAKEFVFINDFEAAMVHVKLRFPKYDPISHYLVFMKIESKWKLVYVVAGNNLPEKDLSK